MMVVVFPVPGGPSIIEILFSNALLIAIFCDGLACCISILSELICSDLHVSGCFLAK